MTIKIPTITWPTRDGWTANRQARYPDASLPTRPSNFLTLEEINHLGAELERLRETLTGVAKRRVTEAIKVPRLSRLADYIAEWALDWARMCNADFGVMTEICPP
jgi:hypothetical protein